MGASSGGAFVLQLPQLLPLKAVVSQIEAIPPQMLEHPSPFPPTLFVHMRRDERTSAMVHRCVRKLRGGGSADAQLLVRPLLDHAHLLLRSHRRRDAAASKQVVDALASARLVGADGQLSDDPRATDWRSVVKAAQQAGAALPGVRPGVADSLEADASAVSEVLNVAWAMHEITSDPMGEILHFVAHARLPNDSHRANGSQRTELRARAGRRHARQSFGSCRPDRPAHAAACDRAERHDLPSNWSKSRFSSPVGSPCPNPVAADVAAHPRLAVRAPYASCALLVEARATSPCARARRRTRRESPPTALARCPLELVPAVGDSSHRSAMTKNM